MLAWLSDKLLHVRSVEESPSEKMNEMVKATYLGLCTVMCTCVEHVPLQCVAGTCMCAMRMLRFWLAEYFNRMEAYPRFLTHEQRCSLMQACAPWLSHLIVCTHCLLCFVNPANFI